MVNPALIFGNVLIRSVILIFIGPAFYPCYMVRLFLVLHFQRPSSSPSPKKHRKKLGVLTVSPIFNSDNTVYQSLLSFM